MSKLSFETVESYVNQRKSSANTILQIPHADFSIIIDGQAIFDIALINTFVNYIIQETFEEITRPSYFNAHVAFVVYFLELFTNFPTPKEKDEEGIFRINAQETYEMACAMELIDKLNSLPVVARLKECVDKQIEFINQEILSNNMTFHATDEAVETVSELAHTCLDMANKACDTIDEVYAGLKSGGIFKNLTPEATNSLFAGIQNVLDCFGSIADKFGKNDRI